MIRLIAALSLLLSLLASLTPAIATPVFGIGSVKVQVDESGEDGSSFGVRLPSFLVSSAVAFALSDIDSVEAAEVQEKLPALRSMIDGVRILPDGVFLQVQTDGDDLTFAKAGRKVHLTVLDGGDEVRIEMPLRLLRRVVAHLERACERAGASDEIDQDRVTVSAPELESAQIGPEEQEFSPNEVLPITFPSLLLR